MNRVKCGVTCLTPKGFINAANVPSLSSYLDFLLVAEICYLKPQSCSHHLVLGSTHVFPPGIDWEEQPVSSRVGGTHGVVFFDLCCPRSPLSCVCCVHLSSLGAVFKKRKFLMLSGVLASNNHTASEWIGSIPVPKPQELWGGFGGIL